MEIFNDTEVFFRQATLVLTMGYLNIFVLKGVEIIISIESEGQGELNGTIKSTSVSTNISGYTTNYSLLPALQFIYLEFSWEKSPLGVRKRGSRSAIKLRISPVDSSVSGNHFCQTIMSYCLATPKISALPLLS